jgi:glycosyltransferase involved in cell wall biosynthesis
MLASGRVVRKENGGKGSAIRAALPYIDGDIVVIQDADMEYAPTEVPALIERHNAPTTAHY